MTLFSVQRKLAMVTGKSLYATQTNKYWTLKIQVKKKKSIIPRSLMSLLTFIHILLLVHARPLTSA